MQNVIWMNRSFLALRGGTKNLSPSITSKARSCKATDVSEAFKEKILPLLDQNKSKCLVLALKDLIAKDDSIDDSCMIECVSKSSKKEFLCSGNYSLDILLSGLFLYALINVKNKGTAEYVKEITDEYVLSFGKKEYNQSTESQFNCIHEKEEQIVSGFQNTFDEKTLEAARLFCIEHENEIDLLPICEIASTLYPKHKHINTIINDFNKETKAVQKAILISESLKPYENCSSEQIDKCILLFEKEIKEKNYATKSFFYDVAKYFYRAIERYPDYKPQTMNPFIFKRRYVNDEFLSLKGSLRAYIEDYDYGRKNLLGKDNPPFDDLWNELDFDYCDEETFVFWVNRFIVTMCHHLHGYDFDAEYDDKWKYKDTIQESQLTNMEELFYYAVFLLYESYGGKKK